MVKWYNHINSLTSVADVVVSMLINYSNSVCCLLRTMMTQARSWPGGSGGPDPPEIFQMIFLNRVNPLTFHGEGGTPSPSLQKANAFECSLQLKYRTLNL